MACCVYGISLVCVNSSFGSTLEVAAVVVSPEKMDQGDGVRSQNMGFAILGYVCGNPLAVTLIARAG